jgi:hypothetical protein
MQQLKARVDELALSNEHHLRLKDMNHKAKILEVRRTEHTTHRHCYCCYFCAVKTAENCS